jgi:hypothetical protein
MFHHTVLLRLSPAADDAFLTRVAGFEAAIRSSCIGIRVYRLLPNVAQTNKGFTHALFSVFESRAAFQAYEGSAVHIELKTLLQPVVEDIVVADGVDG